MTSDFNQNFFELFGLAQTFELDQPRLEHAYLELQTRVHPDKFAHLPDADRRVSMQWATRINEGYRTLKNPLARAQYLLSLKGVDTAAESNTAMPPAFLMEQMEWREGVEEARAGGDLDGLEKLLARLREVHRGVIEEIARALGADGDVHAGASAVRRLMFIEKLQHDILDAIEALED